MPNSQQFRAFERRITMLAGKRGTTVARYRRLVGFGVLLEALSEAVAQGVIPLFFVKGGVAMELRLGLTARATRDLDIGLCAPPDEILQKFDAAVAVGYGGFRLRRRGAARLLDNGAHQLEVAVEYLQNPFATVEVDLAVATPDAATDTVPPVKLDDLGLATPRAVPCLSIPEQIAQKMHALTEPMPRGRPNARARDVLDILLLDTRIGVDGAAVSAACERIFAQRGTHTWPVAPYAFPVEWGTTLPPLAEEVGYDSTDIVAIQARFNEFLARLNGSA